MSAKLIKCRLVPAIVIVKRSIVSQSDFALANKMKVLNDNKQHKKVLELFEQLKKTNMEISSSMIITQTLKACANLGDLQRGSNIHQVLSSNLKDDSYVSASLIHLYMQCGEVRQAQSLFDKSINKTLSMYGAMMSGYIKNNQANDAIKVFNEIKNPGEVAINLLFNACAQLGTKEALDLVKKVSNEMPQSFHSNTHVLTSLIDALMKCGDVINAELLFNRSSQKVLQMYGVMMKGYIRNDQAERAINLFKEMKRFDEVNIIIVLNACAQLGTPEALHLTKEVSGKIPQSFYSNSRILTSLIDALLKCGDVEHAQSLFDTSINKTISMYGAMMKGYIRNDQAERAINLFKEMKRFDEVNIIILLNACAQLGTSEALNLTQEVARKIPQSFYSNSRLLTSLIDALAKCGDVEHAQSLFDTSINKTLSMYGAMMKGYIKNNQTNETIKLFNEIKNPGEVAINLLFNACAQLGTKEALDLVKKVSKGMPPSFHSNTHVLTSLLDALMKCGDVINAELLFNRSSQKVLQMYGAMMKGYIHNNQAEKAINLFKEMKRFDEVNIIIVLNACAQLGTPEALHLTKEVSGKIPQSFYSNSRILTSLIDALLKCGDVEHAQSLFDTSINKTISMYGAMMNGFNRENNPFKTLNLFKQLKIDGVDPNNIIYGCVIKALSDIGDYSLSISFIKQVPDSVFVDNQIQNMLIDMWGKTGSVIKAKEVFRKISEPDQIGYTSMINTYGLNGMGTEAIKLYYQMPSKLIGEATHVCVLNACSHSGLVDQARSIFKNIPNKTEKIYTTMIDCLSRASIFEEAQQLIDQYQSFASPVPSMYTALLSGARNEKNTHLAQQIFDRMKKIFPQLTDLLTPATILLANVYASSGDIEKASNIRIQLNKSGAKKQIGLSWTVVNGETYQFRAHDRSHPRSDDIYVELEKISKELIEHGHQYDSSSITRPLEEDETVASVLCGHSERLAIAWNFVANPNTSKIQLTKNLRVCGDCHKATKLIALIRQCEIIVRDANRIHHFYKNGQCSCNDYF